MNEQRKSLCVCVFVCFTAGKKVMMMVMVVVVVVVKCSAAERF